MRGKIIETLSIHGHILYDLFVTWGFPGSLDGKASAYNAGDPGSIPGSEPTPVFMPGKSHGPRSLVGYSPWGRKESDTTERLLLTSSSFVTYCLMKFKVRERHESDNLEGRAVL